MSNAVFPTLPGLKWGTTKAPQWSTAIKRAASGREARASFYSYPTYKFSLSYEVLRGNGLAELQQLMGFFNARQGSFDSFLYEDPNDHTATHEQFGTGNGTRTQFQLVRAYGGTLEPVMAVNGSPVVYYAGNRAGVNVLPNAEFSGVSGGVPPSWVSYYVGTTGAASMHYGAEPGSLAGTNSQYVGAPNLGASTNDRAGIATQTTIDVNSLAGKQICASVRGSISSSAASVSVVVNIDWATASDIYISSSSQSWVVSSAQFNIFMTFALTANAPNNAVRAKVYFWICQSATAGANAAVLFNAPQVCAGSSPTDFIAGQKFWSLNQYGLLTFQSPPAEGVVLDWSGNFYYRCRFTHDSTEFEEFMHQLWSARKVEFQSIKLGS